jgi:hypothetical protein
VTTAYCKLHRKIRDLDLCSRRKLTYTIEDYRKPYALRTLICAMLCKNAPSAIGSADRDLQKQDRQSDKEESDEIRYEELKAVVVVDDRREAKQVTEADGTAHSAEDKLCSRPKDVAPISTFLRFGSKRCKNLPSSVHIVVVSPNRVLQDQQYDRSRAKSQIREPV